MTLLALQDKYLYVYEKGNKSVQLPTVFCLWEHSQTPFLSVKNNKIKAIAIKVGKALDCDTVNGIPAVWKIV